MRRRRRGFSVAAWGYRLRRLGIPDTAPAAIIAEMRADALGEWLPLALADLLTAWTGAQRSQILRGWGLEALADRCENAETADFLARLKEEG